METIQETIQLIQILELIGHGDIALTLVKERQQPTQVHITWPGQNTHTCGHQTCMILTFTFLDIVTPMTRL